MEEMMTKVADYYDEEVEMATQTVLAALEPLITSSLNLARKAPSMPRRRP